MNHLSSATLVDYFDALLSDEEALVVEEHLADCDPCAAAARAAGTLTTVWDGWTTRTHREAYLRVRLSAAVAAAERGARNPAWRERLARWATHWAGLAEGTVQVIMDASGEASRVVTEGLEGLARPGAGWQFALAPTPVPTRGPLAAAAGGPQVTVAVASGGPTQARVAVSGNRRDVVVRIDGLPSGQPPPLTLLIPLEGGAEPRVAVLERQPNVPYLIARFDNVGPGEYVVAFEPQEG